MARQGIISIEGGDGSGKSLLIGKISAYLEEAAVDHVITREPGGVAIAEAIRDILLDRGNTAMDYRTEALLFAAARRQHLVEKVIPAVAAGKVVIFDRYVDSSIVYQGYVRGIGMDEVEQLNQFATEGILPDVTIVLDVDPEVGRRRIVENSREEDRLDKEDGGFHRRVREGYHILAERHPQRIRMVDANGSPEAVFAQVKPILEAFLEE